MRTETIEASSFSTSSADMVVADRKSAYRTPNTYPRMQLSEEYPA